MVILFKGSDVSRNFAPQALALSAGLSAIKHLKKTLILQVTTRYPVETYVVGKKLKDQSLEDNSYFFEDTGMDSLTRRAGVTTFNASHFSNAVLPVVSSDNLFDILKVSKKLESDIEREIVENPSLVGTIIRSAEKLYDNIFVLADGKKGKVIEAILPYIDKTVTCIPQGQKEDISAPSSKDSAYLLTSFDYKSTFSSHVMQKTYDAKRMYVMPYNVDFKDSYTNENMLSFILSNTSPDRSDYSYHLIKEMDRLTRYLIEDEEFEEEDLHFTKKTLIKVAEKKVYLEGGNVKEEHTEKKLFRPSKTLMHVSIDEKFPEEEEEDDPFKELDKKTIRKLKREKKKEEKRLKALEKKEKKKLLKEERKQDKVDRSMDGLKRKEA